jgi:DNA-binding CsgD family transcriptional regulator
MAMIVPGIERNDTPCVELDRQGRISHINGLARERLPDHPGLIVSLDRVRARNRRFDADLQTEIKRVLELLSTNVAPGFIRRTVEPVPLGEDDCGHPIYCWVTYEQERVLVTFDDALQIKRRLDVAAGTYALSPAQRRLAELLAMGTDLARAAGELGVTVNTVRTQLRRMFDKTGTRNQTALISALLSVQRPA